MPNRYRRQPFFWHSTPIWPESHDGSRTETQSTRAQIVSGVGQAKRVSGDGSAVNATGRCEASSSCRGPRAERWRRVLRFALPRLDRDVRGKQLRDVCCEHKGLAPLLAPTIAHRASHRRVIHLQSRRHGGHVRAADVIRPVVEMRPWPASPGVTGERIVNGRPPVWLHGNGVQRFSHRLAGPPRATVSSARRPTTPWGRS
jgi:hypothetical protein